MTTLEQFGVGIPGFRADQEPSSSTREIANCLTRKPRFRSCGDTHGVIRWRAFSD